MFNNIYDSLFKSPILELESDLLVYLEKQSFNVACIQQARFVCEVHGALIVLPIQTIHIIIIINKSIKTLRNLSNPSV